MIRSLRTKFHAIAIDLVHHIRAVEGVMAGPLTTITAADVVLLLEVVIALVATTIAIALHLAAMITTPGIVIALLLVVFVDPRLTTAILLLEEAIVTTLMQHLHHVATTILTPTEIMIVPQEPGLHHLVRMAAVMRSVHVTGRCSSSSVLLV